MNAHEFAAVLKIPVLTAWALAFSMSGPSGNAAWGQDTAGGSGTAATDSESEDASSKQSPPPTLRTLPSISDPLTEEEQKSPLDEYVGPDEIAAKAFAPPPGAKSLSSRNLWVDRKASRVYIDGYVAMNDGPLEMFACPTGTKEHESVVATIAHSAEVHAALLAVGAMPGTTVRFLPRYVPATGQRIRVWVCYRDKQNQFKVVDARNWIRKTGTNDTMSVDWVFAGSGMWKDPSSGREYYRADSGDMICVSNFATAMMDVPVASSAEASELEYSPLTKAIPERGTPVRLVLMPIPLPTDENNGKTEEVAKPTEDILPANEAAKKK
ncbi:hypothetical protein K227x_28140 [Rubripirellula lacrimiformis]|uniref:Uncharacterized protein n=1 Tax=Rubripirellula lacrimiformis TaxID=1930273 RepID=A0A517NBC0_9BACT|nr:YdjY domain-containing protein [Rubripirellula lacrimiformis]QDT04423.1 hypothetical protein K227x_28140 [Rubripirellula lacrimiformis]